MSGYRIPEDNVGAYERLAAATFGAGTIRACDRFIAWSGPHQSNYTKAVAEGKEHLCARCGKPREAHRR